MTHFASSAKKLWKHTLTNSIEDYGVTGSMFIKEWQWKSFNSRIWLMFDSQHQQEEHKSKVWLKACLTTLKIFHFFKAFYEFYSLFIQSNIIKLFYGIKLPNHYSGQDFCVVKVPLDKKWTVQYIIFTFIVDFIYLLTWLPTNQA